MHLYCNGVCGRASRAACAALPRSAAAHRLGGTHPHTLEQRGGRGAEHGQWPLACAGAPCRRQRLRCAAADLYLPTRMPLARGTQLLQHAFEHMVGGET